MTWKELKEEVEGRAKAAGVDADSLRIRLGLYSQTSGFNSGWADESDLDKNRICIYAEDDLP